METKPVENSSGDVAVKKDGDLEEAVVEKKISTFDFTEKTWTDDFVVIVESKRLNVTKAILARASPVFNAMFQADFKEKNSSELELSGKKVEDVQHFLSCIYPDPADVNLDNVKIILPLAEEYQVSNLKSRCKRLLFQQLNATISSDDLYDVLTQASLYNIPDLLEKCVEVASTRTFESYQKANERMTINSEVKHMILERMVSNLKAKTLLEVVKEYYEVDLKTDEKLDIKDYTEWDGSIQNVTVTLDEWKQFEVVLHGITAWCNLLIVSNPYYTTNSYITSCFKMEINTTLEVRRIQIFAKVVLQPHNRDHEAVSRKIELCFDENKEKKVLMPNLSLGSNFDKKGFVYHDRLDIGVYILARGSE